MEGNAFLKTMLAVTIRCFGAALRAMSGRLHLRTFMSENLGARVAMGIVHLRLMTCEGLLLREEESSFQQSMQTDGQFFNGAVM